jgi:hypothetical protein
MALGEVVPEQPLPNEAVEVQVDDLAREEKLYCFARDAELE